MGGRDRTEQDQKGQDRDGVDRTEWEWSGQDETTNIAQVGERLSSKVNVFFKTDRKVGLLTRQPGLHFIPQEIRFPQMVTNCCRFLCYFCRISRQNQRSMFDHLGYLLQNSGIGLGQCNAFIRFDKIENGNLGRPLPSRAQLQKCGSGMYSKLVKR